APPPRPRVRAAGLSSPSLREPVGRQLLVLVQDVLDRPALPPPAVRRKQRRRRGTYRELHAGAEGLRQTKTSKSRIKRLRGLRRPQYRLRVDNTRVFYDVIDEAVAVLAIVPKDGAGTR